MIDKSKITALLKGYSTISDDKIAPSIDDDRINDLAEELVNLFVLPVVSGCSSCGCREYDYVEDGEVCAYCQEPL